MTKNINKKTALIWSILLAMLSLIICTSGCSQRGRYQLVANASNPLVVDTVTGQSWAHDSGSLRRSKHGNKSSGQIGRFKGVVVGIENYIIDTTTGRVWDSSSGSMGSKKDGW